MKTRCFSGSEIAVVGMACRFPGAVTVAEFWRNLCEGVESLTNLSDEELRRSGVPPSVYQDPGYVRRASMLDDVEGFDAGLFGYSPAEARLVDPQQRLFMECSWEALERAGYVPGELGFKVGVFTGSKTNTYLFNLIRNRELMASLDNFRIALGNDLSSMATQISYRFGLTGPSYALHTACSTSLVAVHLACQSLLLDECRMALAGGAAINVPQRRGYLYQPGGILSPDGSCRTFDAAAAGSNFGNGVGVVVLKRLEDALADGDHVDALILGTATNNDGSEKASFTAPGAAGQTDVILEAMACAGVTAEDLSYVEAHGTATPLGDSIEVLALKQAFRATTSERGFCALGTVKTNLGHLETAAGVAGLMKTALALRHKTLPPSLHCERPAPELGLQESPFYVNTELSPWPEGDGPRRAGVSSFGIGSTNAHAILEEPPPPGAPEPSRPWQLLLLSARSEPALEEATANLAAHLDQEETELSDAAYTLQVGRRRFAHRRAVVCRDRADAVAALRDSARQLTAAEETVGAPVALLLPGMGDQTVGMGRELYETEAEFRRWLDRCAELVGEETGTDLREVLYPPADEPAPRQNEMRRLLGRGGAVSENEARLQRTEVAQPALFAVEYALARLWMGWGMKPQAMIGYSLGEVVAAGLAGVLSLEDAVKLVTGRARRIAELPPGAMLGVSLPAPELEAAMAEVGPGLSLAAVNAASLTVAAGEPPAVEELERHLTERGVACRRLATTHAFHSPLLEPLRRDVTAIVEKLSLSPPEIPYLSNLTGTWITAQEATDPGYWARHMCAPVRFADGITELLADGRRVLLELGTGRSLSSFVKVHPDCAPERHVLHALPAAHERQGEQAFTLSTLGRLWTAGADVDWSGFYAGERRRRCPLPTYPFERQSYWVEPDGDTDETAAASAGRKITLERQELDDWLYAPSWEAAPLPEAPASDGGLYLVLGEPSPLAAALLEGGYEVVEASFGDAFGTTADGYSLPAGEASGYVSLFETLRAQGQEVRHVVHVASSDSFSEAWDRQFLSLLFLAQAVGRLGLADPKDPMKVTVVTSGAHAVSGEETLHPESALALGPCRVIPQELPGLTCRNVDLESAADTAVLVAELAAGGEEVVAWRGGERFVQHFAALPAAEEGVLPRQGGTYLLTGGLGGLGLALAEHLARRYGARLVLVGRSAVPEDPDDERRRKLREVEEAGGQVLALAADVTDREQMTAVREAALERFGRIDGIVHLAGIPGGGIIQLKTAAAASEIVAPKARGALVLAEVFADLAPDFVVLYSSIASILGELGQVDYCGANAFLDVFASAWRRRGTRVTAVNWDIWREVGLAVYTEVPEHLRAWRQEMLALGMTSAEGTEVFERVLRSGAPQVIVSTQPLLERIELGRSLTGERFLHELGGGVSAPAAAPLGAVAGSDLERAVFDVWQRILGHRQPGRDDNFFDLGGNSLLGLQLVGEMNRELGTRLTPVELFEHPTIAALVRHLSPEEAAPSSSPAVLPGAAGDEAVAVVGMAGRFPGAADVGELWRNLHEGRDSFVTFSEEELLEAGVDPDLLSDPRYVPVGAVLEDVDKFDAALFGYSPREAEVMDPQHRLFLECAWAALEDAGHDPQRHGGAIGVFGGSSINTYVFRFQSNPAAAPEPLQLIIGNDKDSLTTSASYKLGLTGPSVGVQTFCSTSLVAVHLASKSLLAGECDMALAGGVSLSLPQKSGYLFQEGSILSPDGRCRPFDADAQGTVSGNAVAMVALRRLSDALADGDHVYAVIRGSAINNDGSVKAGYTAPSVGRQADVVTAALHAAGVDAESISYVETHGTGTPLGDPIEVTALTRAFRETTEERGYCALGSLKSNVGHLDRASGVSGLIKTVLALEHGEIPPSLGFERPNPKIDFATSPFFVNAKPRPWPRVDGTPRRAGVSSLGFGGTNAHVILEEAPADDVSAPPAEAPGRPQLLLLSARTPEALDASAERLAAFLEERPEVSLADVAFTLQVGRRELAERRFLLCRDAAEAVAALRAPERSTSATCRNAAPRAVFLFPGQGSQYPGMGRGLYAGEPVFRRELDRSAEILSPLGVDLSELLYGEETEESAERLAETRFTQPALFAVEYALARLFMAWGIAPAAMIGHSIGEYVAACLAGVFTLDDALRLVAERGRLIQELPAGGAMLAVPLAEEDLAARLEGRELELAAANAPDRLVVSGAVEELQAFAGELSADGVDSRLLKTSHAFHSSLLEPVVEPFQRLVAEVERRPPEIPFVSCLTGTWITAEEAVDPGYWAAQLRQPVRFSAGAAELLSDGSRVLLEVGPGNTLTTLVRRQGGAGEERAVVSSLPSPKEKRDAADAALTALGRVWLAGLSPDWKAVHGAARRRVPLPTYPFERQRFWVEETPGERGRGGLAAGRKPRDWLFRPTWKSVPAPRPASRPEGGWLIVGGRQAEALAEGLRELELSVTQVSREEADNALGAVPPAVVLCLPEDGSWEGLLHLARSLGRCPVPRIPLWVVTRGLHEVLGDEAAEPRAAALLAACRAVNRGYANVVCRHFDAGGEPARSAGQILAEVLGEPRELTVAWRGTRRWVPAMEAVEPEEEAAEDAAGLPGGTWLVTGGLDDPGFSVAAALAAGGERRLVLAEAEGLPAPEEWEELEKETPPGAEQLSAFLATLKAERGLPVDLAEEGAAIPERLAALAEVTEREHVPADFDTLSDTLCASYARRFLAGQVDVAAGREHTRQELAAALGVVPRFERFFHYLLHVLERTEMARLDGERVTFLAVPERRQDPESLSELIIARHPELAPGIECVAHCAAHYPEAFRGAVDPVSILFPSGNPEMLRRVMETQERFSVNRLFEPLMVERIREAAERVPHRPLRVLEVGAGDGNLTWKLAEHLRDANVEYHFTDLGRAFVLAGRKAAAERGLDFLRFGVFDAARDPAEQGYERYSFDVLVAFDVIHATPRVRETMANLKRLLVPGGFTMFLEPSRDQHWITLIWGLAEGWWLFADEELRTLHPLLSPGAWEEALSDLGFSYTGVFPLDSEERDTVDHSLLMVQQPADLATPEYLESAAGLWQARRRRAAERLRRYRELERRGTSPEVTADPERWRAAAPSGVVHAAGPWNGDGTKDPETELDPSAYTRVLEAGAAGFEALEEAFGGADAPRPETALVVSPLAAAGDEALGPENALELYLSARAARGTLPWRSVAWGVAPPRPDGADLGAGALTALGRRPDLTRLAVTPRPPEAMAAAWNRVPPTRPAPGADAGGGGTGRAPSTEEEKSVAEIWRKVLGVERLSLDDNFFELGGDSLIATQIHARIRETCGVELPMEKLFELQTVAAQAEALAEVRREAARREHEEVMAVLAEMSDEEAQEMLRELS